MYGRQENLILKISKKNIFINEHFQQIHFHTSHQLHVGKFCDYS